jgi:ribosomal protein S18 acetylase RimI-like enzyme
VSPAGASIRAYQAGDLAAVYDVCIRTGDNGEDATGTLRDVQLLPDIYAGPYLYLQPDLAFVLDDGERPVGYVIGTADTAAFVRSYRDEWLPRLARTNPRPPPPERPATPDDVFLEALYHPEHMLRPELSAYPAHLHIDILPAYQGAGDGRRLIETFVEAVGRAGAGGVHLAVSPTNTHAQGFYQRVGFERLAVGAPGGGGAFYYGLKTGSRTPVPGGTP